MWQSKDDIVKDLAFLNDFGEPGDEEPYKFLYSLGRGSKIKEKPNISKKFLDSRTGELINIDDEVGINLPFQENKGRGSVLGSYLRKKTQLQEQLRLARPLGSGDGAIESYCRRNISSSNAKNSTKTDSEAEIQAIGDSKFDKTKQRIKAVRSSGIQSNALISNLLSKTNASTSDKEMSINYDNYECSGIDPDNEQKNDENDPKENKEDEKNDFSESESFNELKKQINTAELEEFEIIKSDEKNAVKMETECAINFSHLEDTKQREDLEVNEKYKRLGETINGSSELISKNYVKKMQHFNQCLKCIAPIQTNSDLEPMLLNKSDADIFVYNEDEFPPLGKY